MRRESCPRTRVRDKRENPHAWQEKEALRRMRDHYGASGMLLVKMRSLYLALTEWASDNESDLVAPDHGLKEIFKYSGLSHQSYPKARDALISLGLINWLEERDGKGIRVGYVFQLNKCPSRSQASKEVPAEGFSPSIHQYGPTRDSLTGGNLTGDSRAHIEDKTKVLIEDKTKVEVEGLVGQVPDGPTTSNKSQIELSVSEVIQHLNSTCAREFDVVKGQAKHVRARLRDDKATVADMKLVAEYKQAEWGQDDKMRPYLRPVTLFSAEHYEDYLSSAKAWDARGRPSFAGRRKMGTAETIQMLKDWADGKDQQGENRKGKVIDIGQDNSGRSGCAGGVQESLSQHPDRA